MLPRQVSAQSANEFDATVPVSSPATPVVTVALTEPKQGSLAAEIAMGTLGDLLGMTVTAGAALPMFCLECAEDGIEEPPMEMAIGISLIPRPLLVGGFTALGGKLSHGEGRAGLAMVGAIPGTMMIGAAWLLEGRDLGEAMMPLLVLGHVATIGGAVAAYRYSARSVFSERMARALRYAPSPYVDRQRGVAGLSLSGSF